MATDDIMDPNYSPVRRYGLNINLDAVDERTQYGADVADQLQAVNRQTLTAPAAGTAEDEEPAFDLAVDPISGKVYSSLGEFDGTPDNLYALYDAIKEGKVKPLGKAPRGKVGSSFDEYLKNIDDTEHESSLGSSAAQGLLGSLGAASESIDLMSGTDAPDSWFSDKAEELRQGETMGQRAAKRAHFYESPEALGSNLATFGGNIAGTLAGSGGGALAGAAVAGPAGVGPGALAGGAIAGGGMTAGDAGKAAYQATMQALKGMPQEEAQNLIEYQLMQSENPDASHEEISRMMATEAAQAAMIPGAILGAGEAFVGGKLGGQILKRFKIDKLLGLGDEAATAGTRAVQALEQRATPLSRTERALRATARGSLAAAGEIATEELQTGLPGAAAAKRTGIGSTDPFSYMDWETAEAVGPGAFLMGAFAGGGHGPSVEEIARNNPVGQALSGEVMPERAIKPEQRLLGAPDSVIELGQYTEPERELLRLPPPQRRIAHEPQDLFGYMDIPHRDELSDRQNEIATQAAEIQRRAEPFQQQLPIEQQAQQAELFGAQPPPGPGGQLFNVPQQTPQQAEMDMSQPPQQLEFPGPAPPPPGPPRPNLTERRTFQQMQGEESPVATSPAGQQLALPAPAGSAIEAQIQDLEAQRAEIVASEQQAAEFAASARRNSPEWRSARAMLRAARQDIADLDDQIDSLGDQWAQEREAAGPSGVRPGVQVEAPTPPAAPAEAAPSGNRPMGVAPVPLENPAPMSPGEAASRAQTQQKRRGAAPAPAPTQEPIVPPAPATAARPAIPADQGPPTAGVPEPQADIKAQIAALADPASGRTAVLVQTGNKIPPRLPKNVKRYPGTAGTLLTADPVIGEKYRAGKLTDKQLGKVLGAVVGREEAAKSPDVTVVQAVTPSGAVQADQVTTKGKKGEAAKAVSKQAQPSATVREVTPQEGMAERVKKTVSEQLKEKEAARKAAGPSVQMMITQKMVEQLRALDWTPAEIQKMKPAQAADIIKNKTRRENQGDRIKREQREREIEEAKELAEQRTREARKAAGGKAGLGPKGATAVATSKKGKQGTAQPRDTSRVTERAKEIEARLAKLYTAASGKPLTPQQQQDLDIQVDRIVRRQVKKAVAAISDVAKPAGSITSDTLVKMAETVPAVVVTGTKGKTVDARVVEVDPVQERKLQRRVESDPNSKAGKDAKKQLGLLQQFKIALSAATDAAAERLKASLDTADTARLEHRTNVEMDMHAEQQAGKPGRPRETPRKSPILYLPLTVAETRGYLRAARAEAKAERKKYDPETSVYRQMLSVMVPSAYDEMATKKGAQKWIEYLADKSDLELETILAVSHTTLTGSAFAKQVMRGSSEVAHAIDRVAADPDELEAMAEATRVTPQVTVHRNIPPGAASLLAGWITHFERAGNKFAAPVHLMTKADATAEFPKLDFSKIVGAFTSQRSGLTGQIMRYIIVVDEQKFVDSPLAFAETLAHEYSHLVVEELYTRADERTKKKLENAFNQFLKRQEGHFANDILLSEMTPFMRSTSNWKHLNGDTFGEAYVRRFQEWGARNVALFLTDPARPTHTVMEKFWKRAADILSKVWADITGHPKPDAAWVESVERWIDGTLVIEPTMPATRVAFPGAPESMQDLKALAEQDPVGVDDVENQPDLMEYETELDALDSPTSRKTFGDLKFDEDTGPMKLGRRVTKAATEGVSGIRGLFEPAKESKLASALKRPGYALMSMRDMVRMLESAGSKAAESVKGWMRHMNEKSQLAKQKQEVAAQWVRKAGQLTKKQQFYLEQIMAKATTYKIHPDLKWDDEGNKHLHDDDDKVKAENKKRYDGLRETWELLVEAEPKVENIYKGLRDEIRKLHEESFNLREKRINETTWLSEDNKKKALSLNNELYMRDQNGPYFPLKRFGDWIITVKLPHQRIGKDGKVNGDFFSDEKAAKEEQKRQRAMHPDAKVSVAKTEDGWAVNMDVRAVKFYESQAEARSPEARAELLAEVKERYADVEGGYEAVQKELKDEAIISEPIMKRSDYGERTAMGAAFGEELAKMIEDREDFPAQLAEELRFLQYQSLPENNYTKQLLPRNNIIGASKNMLQSYVVGLQGAANNFARLTHGKSLDDNWEDAWKAARKDGDASAMRVLEELGKNQKLVAKRERESVSENTLSTVSQINSVYSLGFSIPYALSNMTQPWTVAVPVLAAFANGRTGAVIGNVKAAKYMKNAYEDAFGFFGKRAVQETITEWRGIVNKGGVEFSERDFQQQMIDRFAKDDPQFAAVMQHLYDSGLLDYTFISAMSDTARSSGQGLAKIQRLSMAFPAQIEAMNRLVTAKAAVNLARDEFLIAEIDNNSEMSLFAEDIVAQTQGDYSRSNRARVFNTAVGGLALQFKQYMQMMYMLFGHNLIQSMRPGASKAQRVQALRTMRNLMMTHGAIAGVAGMGPVAMAAKLVLWMGFSALGDEDDEWKTVEQLQSEVLKDLLGESAGEVVDQGLPRLLGWDLGDRQSFPDVLDTRFLGVKETAPPSDWMDAVLAQSAGAAYANVKRVTDGARALAQGRGWDASKALPSGLRPIVQSVRMAQQGMVDGDGDVVIPASDLSWNDMAIKAIGGQPARIARKYEDTREVKGTLARIQAKRQQIMRDARNGDIEWAEVQEFNQTVRPGFRISKDQLAQAMRAKTERETGKLPKGEAAVRKMLGR